MSALPMANYRRKMTTGSGQVGPRVSVNVGLSREIYDELSKIATPRQMSLSHLIASICREHLLAQAAPAQPDALVVQADAIRAVGDALHKRVAAARALAPGARTA